MNKSSWTELIEINRKKCEDIVACSKNVRYAGCFNEYGRTIAGKIRPGVKPVFSPNVIREEFFVIASTMKSRQKISKGLGELKYILINHKKIIILLFSKNTNTYYITFDQKTPPGSTLINKIRRTITK